MPKPFRNSVRAALLVAAMVAAAAPLRAQQPAQNQEPDTQPELLNARALPRIISREYPVSMRGRRAAANVAVRMKILEDGTVDSSSISVEESPEPDFNAPAVRVAMQMRFRPATLAGEPVQVWVTMPVTFIRRWNPSGDSEDVQRCRQPPAGC